MKKISLFFGWIFACLHFMQTQNIIALPEIINYDKNIYGGGSQTWNINQDKNGIMYFANNNAMLTFDGTRWSQYQLPNKSIVRSIAIADDGRIYVGGQNQIGFYYPNQNGVLNYHSLLYLLQENDKEFADVWNIDLYGQSVFFRTNQKIFQLKQDSIQTYLPKSEWVFFQTTSKQLLVQDKLNGLFQFDEKSNSFLALQIPLKNTTITGIVKIGVDSSLIFTLKHGIYLLHNNTLAKKHTFLDKEYATTLISGVVQINPNHIALTTNSKGILIIDKHGQLIQELNNKLRLQDNDVLSVFLDKHNNLWVGLNNGISVVKFNSAISFIHPNKTNELFGYATSVHKNNLYVATSNGVYRSSFNHSNKDGGFIQGNFEFVKNTDGQVWNLNTINNELFVLHSEGLYTIQNNKVKSILSQSGLWRAVLNEKSNDSTEMLIGTYYGVYKINKRNKQLSIADYIDSPAVSLRFLCLDSELNIWASHPLHGVYKIQKRPSSKQYTSTLYTKKDGLPADMDNYVFKIKGEIICGTIDGIYQFNPITKRFEPSFHFDNIFQHIPIQYLIEDEEGNLWFANDKNIGVAKRSTNNSYELIYFSELQYQFLKKFQNIYPYNKGNIFIGAENGVIHLDFAKYLEKQIKPQVYLHQIKILGDGDSVIYAGYKTLSSSQNSTEKIPQFDYRLSSFAFEYSCPNIITSQNHIEYAYQLVGYDERWSNWSSKTFMHYTNLTDKKYTFLVKARENINNESVVLSYSFIVKPAWYNSIWAYILYAFFAVYAIYYYKVYQQKKYDKKKLLYEAEQQKMIYIQKLEIDRQEQTIIKLQNEKLENEVKSKTKELVTTAMHLDERNNVLKKITQELTTGLKNRDKESHIKNIVQILKNAEYANENWHQFAIHFDEINDSFLEKLKNKYRQLSHTDLKLC